MISADGRSIKETAGIGFQGASALTVGLTYTPQRALGVNCTVAGNVTLTLANGSSITFAIPVGFNIYSFAVASVASTTATATFYNMS